ncbi:MAG: GIY-YIG nuclease family protein [Ignavibacteriales bacterium]|nr:GIY-YIG nuclease family protein [Ignavibacteriales bacterium]
MKPLIPKKDLDALPNSPGVYLFYSRLGELLYVGKSKTIRTRVRSHFADPSERWVRRRVVRIETRETAGELGALLLESKLIKELRPMFNVASRRRRKIVIAEGVQTTHGYLTVKLEEIDYLSMKEASPIMAIFKHTTQAKEFLDKIAKEYRLCPKLLKLEPARKHCFSYHLGQCNGACMGEEAPALYNARFEEAFNERRVQAWPYESGVLVEERSANGKESELFLIDNWCLIVSFKRINGNYQTHIKGEHRFDLDSYKILYSYLTDEANFSSLNVLSKKEYEKMRRQITDDRMQMKEG